MHRASSTVNALGSSVFKRKEANNILKGGCRFADSGLADSNKLKQTITAAITRVDTVVVSGSS